MDISRAAAFLLLKSAARFVWAEGDMLHAMVTKHNPIINNGS